MEETLLEAKGGSIAPSDLETRVDLKVDAYLPGDYVRDEKQRMEMYKRIAALSSDADREDITDELVDRFGDTPAVVDALLDIAQLRALANRLGVSQVLYRTGTLTMRLDSRCAPDLGIFLQALSQTDGRLSLSAKGPTALLLRDASLAERDMLREGVKVLKKLCEQVDALREAQLSKA